MCGIAGIVHLNGRPLDQHIDRKILNDMASAMSHRGPDDESISIWNNVGLAFRRLAINDLDGGTQPFETPDGRISVIANGEIYNHKNLRRDLEMRHTFKSKSDCEVLPYLYLDHGMDMFDSVNGMYAVALLDRQRQHLLLARDRLGEKPLFYCILPESRSLVFASELKSLFSHPGIPRRFDWSTMLTRVQNVDMSLGERPSGFVDIERVPAGTILKVPLSDGNHTIHRYWKIPEQRSVDTSVTHEQCVLEYRSILEESVHLREEADVDCGLFLSGGIDSAAIAALSSRRHSLPTFSIDNISTRADADAAANVADHLGMINHRINFESTGTRASADDWRRILWSCEYPDINAEQLFKFYLHAFAKQHYPNLKVILLGQGSDEFNGGYMSMRVKHPPPYSNHDWQRMGDAIRTDDARHIAFCSGLWGRLGMMVESGVIKREFISAFGGRKTGSTIWDSYVQLYRGNLDTHLWHEDRTAAAHSIEDRVPFIDHRLVEFLAKIPERLHSELFTDKKILRLALADRLPEYIVNRPKGPLFYGDQQHHTFKMMHTLLTRSHGALIEQAIEGSRITDGPIDPDQTHRLAKQIANDPRMANFEQFLSIINMGVLAYMANTLEHPNQQVDYNNLPVEEINRRNVHWGNPWNNLQSKTIPASSSTYHWV